MVNPDQSWGFTTGVQICNQEGGTEREAHARGWQKHMREPPKNYFSRRLHLKRVVDLVDQLADVCEELAQRALVGRAGGSRPLRLRQRSLRLAAPGCACAPARLRLAARVLMRPVLMRPVLVRPVLVRPVLMRPVPVADERCACACALRVRACCPQFSRP